MDAPDFQKKVDEDWKNSVETEREGAAKKPPSREAAGHSSPPPSFESLLSILAAQVYAALGLAGPQGQAPQEPRPDEAKFFIDLLEVIQSKTINNLSADEKRLLEGILYELRLLFLSKKSPA